jgi:hypothetical protein
MKLPFLSLFTKAAPAAPVAPRMRSSGSGQVQGYAGPPLVNSGTGSYFEALRTTHDRTPIPVLSPETRGWVESLGRERLSGIARYLYDNTGVVSYAIDTLANYSVPLIPQAATDSDDWNTAAEAYFADWSVNAEFTGRFDFDEVQRQIVKAIGTDGDLGILLTAENGLPQVQLVEGWRIRNLRLVDGNRDGCQTDAKGRVLGYWIDEGDKGSRFISANELFLAADFDRTASYRGFTPLRRGMNDVRDVSDLKAFEKLAQKVRASVPAVLEGDAPIEEDVWGDDTGNAANAGTSPQDKKLSLAELLGGDIPNLPNGKKLTVLSGDRNPQPVTEFLAALVGHFVYGLGIPPAFFLDEKLTGPNVRSVNGKAQRVFNRYKRIMRRFILWTWRRVIGDAIARGLLPAHPQWDRLNYQSPAEISIDTGDAESADREALGKGYKTRQEVYGKRGLDWVAPTMQVFREQRFIFAEAAKLAEESGVPLHVILAAHGFEAAKPVAPNPNDPQKANPPAA